MRAWSPEALERRVAAIEATGLGLGWVDGDVGHGPAYRFTDPDGHVFEVFYEAERYVAPDHLKPSWRNQPQRYVGRGAGVKRLDHVNLLAADVRASRVFAEDVLGYRLYEAIRLEDGTETGAWLSLSIAAHELIYVADAHGARGRLHHLAFWVDTREECLRAADIFVDNGVPIEAAPSKHAIAQGFFLYGFEPGGNRIEVTTGGYFVYDPDFEPIDLDARGAGARAVLGRPHDRELPHLRDPARRRGRMTFRERLAEPGSFVVAAELVTSRGLITANSGQELLAVARALAEDPRVDVLSITDNPGGHAMLAPDTLGTDLVVPRAGGRDPPLVQGLEPQRPREPRVEAQLGRVRQRSRALRRLSGHRSPGAGGARLRHRLRRPDQPARRDERRPARHPQAR